MHLIFNNDTNIKIRKTTTGGTKNDQLVSYNTNRLDYLKIVCIYVDEQRVILFINGFKIFDGNVSNISFNALGVAVGRNFTLDANQRQSTNGLFLWSKKLTDIESIELTSDASFSEMASSQNYEIQ